jgi:hypothetical protein
MQKNNTEPEPIPKHFKNIEEAAEFWDTHDLGDYWNMTKEVHFETDIQSRVFLAAIEPLLAKKLNRYASKQGISTETVINAWLGEKIASVTS